MIVAYIACPYSAETSEGRTENRRRARKWAAWAARQGLSPVCSWIALTQEFEETPELREMGLAIDCAQVERCDLMLLCGPRISSGMLREASVAKAIVDFTWLEFDLPEDPIGAPLLLQDGQIISFVEAERRAAKHTPPVLFPGGGGLEGRKRMVPT